MMSKFRALIVALLLLLGVTTVAVNQNVLPASALYSCVFSPGATGTGSYYAGTFCNSGIAGGLFHYSVARCQYRLLGIYHTYTVTGPYASDGQWSWVYCGSHLHDSNAAGTNQTYDRTGYYDKVISLQASWS